MIDTNRRGTLLGSVVLALFGAACAGGPRQETSPDELGTRLQDPDAAARAAAAQEAWRAGAPGVPAAGALLGSDDPAVAKQAQLALAAIAHHASRPEAEEERRRVSAALVKLLDGRSPAGPLGAGASCDVLRLLGTCADDDKSIRAVAAHLSAPDCAQAALFALERIAHPAAEQALIAALSAETLAVTRTDVVRALGARRSTVASGVFLVMARGSSEEDARAARAALALLGEPRAAEVLSAAHERGQPGAAADLLRFADERLADGAAAEAAPLYALLLDAPEEHLRSAALRGTARAAGSAAAERLLAALSDASPAVRAVAREALVELRPAIPAALVVAAHDRAGPLVRGELLAVLVGRGEPEASAGLRRAIEDGPQDLRVVALELAGERLDPLLVPLLERWMRAGEPAEREAASDSLVRFAQRAQDAGELERALELYHALLSDAPDGRAVVAALRGVAAVADPRSLERLAALNLEARHRGEVDRARVAIAVALADSDRERAVQVLEAVCTSDGPRSARQEAARALGGLGVDVAAYAPRRGFLVEWWLCGPFPAPGEEDFAEHPFGPDGPVLPSDETPASAPGDPLPAWQRHRSTDVDGLIDLARHYERNTDVAVFACADLERPAEEEAVLKLGSDDGVVVWVNGEEVHAHRVSRGVVVDQDVVPVRLRAGANRIVVKIVQGGGGWGFCVRLCDAAGEPVGLTP